MLPDLLDLEEDLAKLRHAREKAKRQLCQRQRRERRAWGRAPVIGRLVAPGVDVGRYLAENLIRLH